MKLYFFNMYRLQLSFVFLFLIYPINNFAFNVQEEDLKEFQPNLIQEIKNFFRVIKASRELDVNEIRRLNWFFDNQLKYVKYYGYYVIPLPNINAQFKNKIGDTAYDGDIELTSGLMVSLDLKRKCNVTINYEYPVATLEFLVGFDNIEYLYHYKASFMGITTRGGVKGVVKDTSWMLILNLDVVDMNLTLQHYNIQKNGDVTSTVEGDSKWRSWLFQNVTEPLIQPHIKSILNKYTKNITLTLIEWYNKYLSTTQINDWNPKRIV